MDINKELKDLEKLLSSSKLTNDQLDDAQDKIKNLKTEVDTLSSSDPLKSDYEKRLTSAQTRLTASIATLKSTGKETKNFFEELLGEISVGLDANADGVGSLTEAGTELEGVFTNLGENLKFWREYDRRIREVGVSYGISANRLEDFRERNKELEQTFLSFGMPVKDLSEAIGALYQETDRTNAISLDFVNTVGGLSMAMGISANEAGKIVGQFSNLNMSYQTTGKILNDLRNSAEKAGLNTQKVLKQFTDSFEKLNTYSFKNGVQGMMEMVKQSNMLKINMDAVLGLSDKFADPEQTMEFASSMQLLGGAFGQLGDFNKLMYDAAVAPEELAKNIASATSSLGSFNRETGQIELSFADAQYMRELEKNFGMSRTELNKMAVAAKKLEDIKMNFSMRPLTEDQLSVISSVAEFKDGEYRVMVGGESKSIAELSDEDIEKISKTKETEELKSLTTQKFDAYDMTAMNLKIAKYESPDSFKALGGLSEDLKISINEFEKDILKVMGTTKKELFTPLEDFLGNITSDFVSKNLKEAGEGINFLNGGLEKLIGIIAKSDIGEEIKKEMEKAEKKEKGDVLRINQYAEGKLLEGASHSEGGIPFTIGGRSGFEAEGGEVLLTKGVSEDPLLLSIASRINEMGGGKKLYEYGDILNNNTSLISSNYNSLEKKIDDGDKNIETINNLLNSNYDTSNTKLFEDGDIIKNSNQSVNSIYNVLNKKLDPIKDITPKNETIVNNNYNNVSKEIFEDGGVVDSSVNTNSLISESTKNISSYNETYLNSVNNAIENLRQQNTSYESVINSMGEVKDRIKEMVQNLSQFTTINTNLNYPSANYQTSNINNNELKNNISNEEYNSLLSKYITQPGVAGQSVQDFYSKTNNTSETTNQSVDALYVKTLNYESMMSNIANANQNTTQYGGISNEFKDITNMVGDVGKVVQGGLVERRDRTDLINGSINVNGNVKVDGTIAFSNPTIKVTIDGLGGEKEMPIPKNISDEIYKTVADEISKMSLYTKYITQKDTGIIDGKSVNIPGITSDIGRIT